MRVFGCVMLMLGFSEAWTGLSSGRQIGNPLGSRIVEYLIGGRKQPTPEQPMIVEDTTKTTAANLINLAQSTTSPSYESLMTAVWGRWTHWSPCSPLVRHEIVSGHRYRSRQCINPDNSSFTGEECSGVTMESKPCPQTTELARLVVTNSSVANSHLGKEASTRSAVASVSKNTGKVRKFLESRLATVRNWQIPLDGWPILPKSEKIDIAKDIVRLIKELPTETTWSLPLDKILSSNEGKLGEKTAAGPAVDTLQTDLNQLTRRKLIRTLSDLIRDLITDNFHRALTDGQGTSPEKEKTGDKREFQTLLQQISSLQPIPANESIESPKALENRITKRRNVPIPSLTDFRWTWPLDNLSEDLFRQETSPRRRNGANDSERELKQFLSQLAESGERDSTTRNKEEIDDKNRRDLASKLPTDKSFVIKIPRALKSLTSNSTRFRFPGAKNEHFKAGRSVAMKTGPKINIVGHTAKDKIKLEINGHTFYINSNDSTAATADETRPQQATVLKTNQKIFANSRPDKIIRFPESLGFHRGTELIHGHQTHLNPAPTIQKSPGFPYLNPFTVGGIFQQPANRRASYGGKLSVSTNVRQHGLLFPSLNNERREVVHTRSSKRPPSILQPAQPLAPPRISSKAPIFHYQQSSKAPSLKHQITPPPSPKLYPSQLLLPFSHIQSPSIGPDVIYQPAGALPNHDGGPNEAKNTAPLLPQSVTPQKTPQNFTLRSFEKVAVAKTAVDSPYAWTNEKGKVQRFGSLSKLTGFYGPVQRSNPPFNGTGRFDDRQQANDMIFDNTSQPGFISNRSAYNSALNQSNGISDERSSSDRTFIGPQPPLQHRAQVGAQSQLSQTPIAARISGQQKQIEKNFPTSRSGDVKNPSNPSGHLNEQSETNNVFPSRLIAAKASSNPVSVVRKPQVHAPPPNVFPSKQVKGTQQLTAETELNSQPISTTTSRPVRKIASITLKYWEPDWLKSTGKPPSLADYINSQPSQYGPPSLRSRGPPYLQRFGAGSLQAHQLGSSPPGAAEITNGTRSSKFIGPPSINSPPAKLNKATQSRVIRPPSIKVGALPGIRHSRYEEQYNQSQRQELYWSSQESIPAPGIILVQPPASAYRLAVQQLIRSPSLPVYYPNGRIPENQLKNSAIPFPRSTKQTTESPEVGLPTPGYWPHTQPYKWSDRKPLNSSPPPHSHSALSTISRHSGSLSSHQNIIGQRRPPTSLVPPPAPPFEYHALVNPDLSHHTPTNAERFPETSAPALLFRSPASRPKPANFYNHLAEPSSKQLNPPLPTIVIKALAPPKQSEVSYTPHTKLSQVSPPLISAPSFGPTTDSRPVQFLEPRRFRHHSTHSDNTSKQSQQHATSMEAVEFENEDEDMDFDSFSDVAVISQPDGDDVQHTYLDIAAFGQTEPRGLMTSEEEEMRNSGKHKGYYGQEETYKAQNVDSSVQKEYPKTIISTEEEYEENDDEEENEVDFDPDYSVYDSFAETQLGGEAKLQEIISSAKKNEDFRLSLNFLNLPGSDLGSLLSKEGDNQQSESISNSNSFQKQANYSVSNQFPPYSLPSSNSSLIENFDHQNSNRSFDHITKQPPDGRPEATKNV